MPASISGADLQERFKQTDLHYSWGLTLFMANVPASIRNALWDLLRLSLMLVSGRVWSCSKQKSGCISARRAWGCYSFPSSFSILPPCPSAFGSLQTLLAPTWNLGLKRPAAAGRPLAVAQRFALEKQTQTCDAVLALWTASKQPKSR